MGRLLGLANEAITERDSEFHMVPLVDTHCHLLPPLDDGPSTWEDAVAMCRMAWDDGVGAIAALAHQNDHYPDVTPSLIRETAAELARRLSKERIPLAIYPCAEVMISAEIVVPYERELNEAPCSAEQAEFR